jgi:hypothetical protein
MTIKEIMQIGTSWMTEAEKKDEQERRIKVVERVNYMADMIERINAQLKLLPNDYKCCRIWKNRKNRYNRELKRIKADESVWLREAAWFMYARGRCERCLPERNQSISITSNSLKRESSSETRPLRLNWSTA